MKLKTLVLTTSFPLRQDSASGIFVKRLVDALQDLVEVQVLTPCDRSGIAPEPPGNYPLSCFRYAPGKWQVLAHGAGGIPAALRDKPLSLTLAPFFLVAMFFSALRAARSCQVIHANWSISGAVAGVVGRLTRRPVVTTLRGQDVSAADKFRSYAVLLRLAFLLSDRIVTVSLSMAEDLSRRYPGQSHKIVTIHNGVDEDLLLCKRPPFDGSSCKVLFVGSLIPLKGVDVLINAMALLDSAHQLWVAGAGDDAARLEQLAVARGVSGRVRFLGAVAPADVPALFEQTDILVLPSYSEGRPNIVMEAMAAGLPVVGSDISGIREVVTAGDNGLLFETGNADALAEQLQVLISNDELRNRLSKGGRAYIRDNELYWSAAARRYCEIFTALAEGRP